MFSSSESLGVRRPFVLGLALVIATLALYYPVHEHPFINYDDTIYVTDNVQIQGGINWGTVRWAFTTFYLGTWNPLTWLSHALDCQLFQLNPAGHHDVNLLLHVINVVLLFWVLLRATGCPGRSFMVAALFALHPINVESVAWIAERKNTLSLLFFLLALGAYRWYTRQPRIGRYVAVALLYALGLLAKSQVITFPFVLLLWDYWPLQRFAFRRQGLSGSSAEVQLAKSEQQSSDEGRKAKSEERFLWLLLEKLPLLVLSAGSAFMTLESQRAPGDKILYPLSIRLETAIVSYAQYLRDAVWPSRLAVFYPHPGNSLTAFQVCAALLLLLAITALVIDRWRQRYLVTGWLWFLGTMVPMIGLEAVGYQGMQGMADRYAYLPFIGLFIMICWGLSDWAEHRRISVVWLAGLSFVGLSILTVVAHRQIGYWSDSATLWSHTLQVTNRNWLAENNLGKILMSQGRVEEGVSHFLKATEIYPNDPVSNMNLGIYELQRGNPTEAIERFKKALISSHDANLRFAAFNDMGRAYSLLGDTARAQECFAAAENLRHPR
ncbi:MAG: tetratricopeptide repeat protein [Candidatus Korobacteraceae bacterium]|jgi:tetratricopeptide (TPR) repeat protein